MRRTIGLALLALAVGCGDGGVELNVEQGPEQIVVAVATVDGRATVTLVPYAPGAPLRVDSDPDRPIYTWVIDPADYVRADGTPIVAADLAQLKVRTDGPGTDGCGRCLTPSSRAPQIVSAGERCHLPAWNRGAVWSKDGDAYRCRGAPDSRVCGAGDAADGIALEQVRRIVWLEWPGACACEPRTAYANLSTLEIEAITPTEAPFPLTAFSAREDGVVAGFSRHGAAVYDPTSSTTIFTRFDDLDAAVRASVALPDGDFLVAAERFNTDINQPYRYYRVPIVDGAAQQPIATNTAERLHAQSLRMLDDAGDSPLYILGGHQGLGSIEPSAQACSTNPVSCQPVNFSRCDDERSHSRVFDLEMLPDGTGVAIAHQGLFYKAPNAPPLINPHPSDPWMCDQFPEPLPAPSGELSIVELGAMTSVGDRVFVCARAKARERCMADFAVVLTATVSAPFGELPEPDWKVTYESGANVYCREFLEPRASGEVRMLLSGHRIVDLDLDGGAVGSTRVQDEYGSFPRMGAVYPMADGSLLGLGSDNQVWVNTATSSFVKIYGPESADAATYRAAAVTPAGDFLVFGHPNGLLRVSAEDGASTLLETDALVSARIEAVALDEAATTGTREVYFVGGAKDGDAFLARVEVDGASVVVTAPLTLPSDLDATLDVVDLAATSPGRFVAATLGTQLLRIDGTAVEKIAVQLDDPTTEKIEELPRPGPDQCSGNVPRVDAWRRVIAAGGVAWVVGQYGLLVRVDGVRTERFAIDERLTISGAIATCADRVFVTGYGTAEELDAPYGSVSFYETTEQTLDPNEEEPRLLERALAFERVSEEEIIALQISEVQYGRPIDLLLDSTADGRGMATTSAVVLTNGFLYRRAASERIEYLRVPFEPRRAVQAPNGTVLFLGGESRLAIGRP